MIPNSNAEITPPKKKQHINVVAQCINMYYDIYIYIGPFPHRNHTFHIYDTFKAMKHTHKHTSFWNPNKPQQQLKPIKTANANEKTHKNSGKHLHSNRPSNSPRRYPPSVVASPCSSSKRSTWGSPPSAAVGRRRRWSVFLGLLKKSKKHKVFLGFSWVFLRFFLVFSWVFSWVFLRFFLVFSWVFLVFSWFFFGNPGFFLGVFWVCCFLKTL